MPRKQRVPTYQRHKHSGQAFVKLNGEFTYLGPHGSKVSLAEYDRVILEWLANGRKLPDNPRDGPGRLMCELAAAYWEFAQEYYRKNGRPTAEQGHIRAMLRHNARKAQGKDNLFPNGVQSRGVAVSRRVSKRRDCSPGSRECSKQRTSPD